MKNTNLPCKECITFPICASMIAKESNLLQILGLLESKCTIFKEFYLYINYSEEVSYKTAHSKVCEIKRLFNIKFDTESKAILHNLIYTK